MGSCLDKWGHYNINEELKEKTQENKYIQKVNKAVSFNIIKHKAFDLFYSDKPLDEMLGHMEKLFLTNTIVIRPERKSKPRLDKDKHKSTIATNSINYYTIMPSFIKTTPNFSSLISKNPH